MILWRVEGSLEELPKRHKQFRLLALVADIVSLHLMESLSVSKMDRQSATIPIFATFVVLK